ncbi:hypothetical protein [Vibrio superstes]|uniref:Transcription elongation factor n=1 Tax=Vibrio superstes NBRC 103154 TaxID=1219062 RepID=A0A511QKE3_9VIBR|nr:hypothetical protein [Vibrio superstes]GEM77794.1 hypothetical protein VSU01S_00390 [Vibrio superstes NBRC 103154]
MIDKELLRQNLIQILKTQRNNALHAADSAHDDATHEQSVAETQYDTVALEAAYLAHGQSQRVADCDAMINRLNSMVLRDFGEDDDIDLGALVTIDNRMTCWFLPICGGYKLEHDVVVITPQSPLGQMLDSAELGEKLEDGRVITDIR